MDPENDSTSPQGGADGGSASGGASGDGARPARRRRWRRRVLVACLGFALLAGLGAGLAAYFAGPLLEAVLPGLLGPALGLELRLDAAAVSWRRGEVTLRGLEGEAREDWATVRSLRVGEASVRVEPLTLLRRGLEGVAEVRLSGVAAEVDLDRPGRPGPTAPEEGAGAPAWPARLPRVRADLDRLLLRSGEDRLAFEDLRLRVREAPLGSRLELGVRTRWTLGEWDGATELRLDALYTDGLVRDLRLAARGRPVLEHGRVDLTGPRARVGRLRVLGGEGRLAGGLRPDGRLEVTASLEGFELGRIAALLGLPEDDRPRGRLALELRGDASLDDLPGADAHLELALSGAVWRDVTLETAALAASLEERRARVTRLELAGPGFGVEGRGLRVSLERLEAEAVLGSIGGAVAVHSDDLGPVVEIVPGEAAWQRILRGASLEGRVQVQGFELVSETLRLDAPLFGLDVAALRYNHRTGDPLASRLELEGRAHCEDLGRVAEAFGAGAARLRGRVAGRVTARGPLRELVGDARLEGEGLAASGLRLGTLDAAIAADGRDLEVRRIVLGGGPGSDLHAILAGSWGLRSGELRSVEVSVQGRDLRARAEGLEAVREWLPQGTFHLEAGAEGAVAWPDLELELSAGGVGPADATEESLHIELTKTGNDVRLEAERLPLAGGRASATVTGRVEPGLVEGALELSRLVVLGKRDRWKHAGTASLRFDRATGALLVDPPLELVRDRGGRILLALTPRAGGEGGGGERPEGAPRGERVPRDGRGGGTANPGEDDAGEAPGTDGALPPASDEAVAAEPAAPGPVALRIEADLPEGLPFAGGPAFTARGLELGLRADLPGSLLRGGELPLPEALTARLRAEELALSGEVFPGAVRGAVVELDLRRGGDRPAATLALGPTKVRLERIPGLEAVQGAREGAIAAELAWDGQRIAVRRLEGELDGVSFGGGGSLGWPADLEGLARGEPPPRPDDLDLELVARAGDLSLVRSAVAGLRRTAGQLEVEARVRGPSGAPRVELDATLTDGQLRWGDLPTLGSVNAAVAFREDRVRIETFRGELGGAPFTVGGEVLGLGGETELDVRLEGDNLLLVRSPNVRLRADARFGVSGPLSELRVEGNLRVTDGRVVGRVPLVELFRDLTRQVRGLASGIGSGVESGAERRAESMRLFSLREAPLDAMRFDVEVSSAEAIELRGNVFRGTVRPELRLRGTGEVPFLVGAVYVDELVLRLPATRLRVESGVVRFPESSPLVPQLALQGTTRLRGYDVTVSVTGTVNDPLVTFASSPPLPSDQLVLLVTTGQPPQRTDDASETRALITVARYLGTDLFRRFFGSGDVDAAESFLDRFELEVGRNVSRSGRETLEAKFRLVRDLVSARDAVYLTGERDAFDHYNLGLRIVFRGQ